MSRLLTSTSPTDVSGILAASDAASGGSTCEINSSIRLLKSYSLSKPVQVIRIIFIKENLNQSEKILITLTGCWTRLGVAGVTSVEGEVREAAFECEAHAAEVVDEAGVDVPSLLEVCLPHKGVRGVPKA